MGIFSAKKENYKYKGYESPSYTVLETKGPIEIRCYEPVLLAEVEVKGSREKAINEGFRILAGYIFGNNLSKKKIAMTTPVVQSQVNEKISMTTPVNQTATEDGWKVSFMMPSQYLLETLPWPKDTRVHFVATKPVSKVVIRFSGLMTEANLRRHLTKLKDYINEHSLNVIGTAQYSFYDAPWTLPFMRRNEISFVIKKKG